MEKEKNQIEKLPSQQDITDLVMIRVNELKESGGLVVPKNYAIQNELKLAYFSLLSTLNKDYKSALEVCTLHSIANSLLKMVIDGLSVAKSQGYFIIYGNKLEFTPSYFGNIAIALRGGEVTGIPRAQIIYKGDEFQYEIKNAKINILSHTQQFENINLNNIIGAYAIVPTQEGEHVELMTMAQIRTSWAMGNARGGSKAHTGFADEMAKRTVINRALKYFNKTQDDSHLFDTNEEPPVFSKEEVVDLNIGENNLDGTTKLDYIDFRGDNESIEGDAEGEITDVDFEEREEGKTEEKRNPQRYVETEFYKNKIKNEGADSEVDSDDVPF